MGDSSEPGHGADAHEGGAAELLEDEEIEEIEESEEPYEETAEDEYEEEHDADDEGDDEDEEPPLSPEELAEMCAKCGGRCCMYYTVMIDEPEDADDFDEMRWFLAHEGNYVYVDEGEWHLNVVARCRFLDGRGRCAAYDHRPDVCRDFGRKEECEFTGEFDFERMLKTIGELEAYAREVLSPEELKKLPLFPGGHEGPQ